MFSHFMHHRKFWKALIVHVPLSNRQSVSRYLRHVGIAVPSCHKNGWKSLCRTFFEGFAILHFVQYVAPEEGQRLIKIYNKIITFSEIEKNTFLCMITEYLVIQDNAYFATYFQTFVKIIFLLLFQNNIFMWNCKNQYNCWHFKHHFLVICLAYIA